MNLESLLQADVQSFIKKYKDADVNKLLLKKSPFFDVTMIDIIQQIKGRKVAQKKFPFLEKENIIFPPNLNLEQASSQSTAEYKAKLFRGNSFIDLTSGFGIDAYFLSQNFKDVTLVEQNLELLKIVEHNWGILNRKANFINQKLEDFLAVNKNHFDVIYLDPARRDNENRKKFLLEDLSPNLLEIEEKLRTISSKIIVKLSPLIDITYLVSVLKNIEEIQIIAVKNEVKELILILTKNNIIDVKISAINLEVDEPTFSFCMKDEKKVKANYSEIKNFLYIPNNAILKSGAFNLLAEKMDLHKLHPNTHFYTSEIKINNFPGRVLEVEKITTKDIKKGDQFNIISKNYPLKPEDIKKKYKIKDGGNRYLIFVETIKGKEIVRSL